MISNAIKKKTTMLMRALTFVILSSSFFLNMTSPSEGCNLTRLSIFTASYPLIKLDLSEKGCAFVAGR
jgi:hypothetical protein